MAVDYFLKFDGIPGESTDSKHKGEIELETFSWGETNTGTHAGSGSGAGKVQIQDFHFTTKVNKASPKLLVACALGQHLKAAVMTARHAGKQLQEFLVYKFSDVLISSYQIAGSAHGPEEPIEQISFNFGRIDIEYRQEKADGTLAAPITAGWDVKKHKKV